MFEVGRTEWKSHERDILIESHCGVREKPGTSEIPKNPQGMAPVKKPSNSREGAQTDLPLSISTIIIEASSSN